MFIEFGFNMLSPEEIEGNLIKMIEKDWMLITAGNNQKINTMTANWGGVGYLWNKPVVYIFVRPERFTYGFIENNDGFTLTFFDESYRKALNLCGIKSGRDCDKISEAGLTPFFTKNNYPAFEEANLILECRKLYADVLSKDAFIDADPLKTHYNSKGGIHKMYIAEIVGVLTK
jgi:flavin reductase (DIM6/NTAB) family NADH-FMN oxidoreductase RutF